MPLATENVVQENSGTGTAAVTLPSGTTAGNTVIVLLAAAAGPGTPPANFAQDVVRGGAYAFRKSGVVAAETSWTFGATLDSWYVAEVSNLDPTDPLDVSEGFVDFVVNNGGTASTNTTAPSLGLDTVAFAAFAAAPNSGQSWSGYTKGFEEVVDLAPGTGRHLAVARKFVNGMTTQYETTATFATSGSDVLVDTLVVAYRAADSQVSTPFAWHSGFEYGTHHGIIGGPANVPHLVDAINGTHGTNYLVQAGSARNGNYGLQIVQTGSPAYVHLAGGVTLPTSRDVAHLGINIRPVSATGQVALLECLPLSGSTFRVWYDPSTSKVGVRWGDSGTITWQSGTTPTNTWAWLEYRIIGLTTATWHVDWAIEESGVLTAQTSPADLTSQTPTALAYVRMGANRSQTQTCDYDDACISVLRGVFPMTAHKVLLVTVDPNATPTLTGSATSFSTFVNNGSLSALNLATARDNLDEVPLVFSASADGVCQDATAAGDYIEFPMASPTLAADETVTAVAMMAAMWGGTGTATGTIGLRGFDGTTETTFLPTSVVWDPDSLTTGSATVPPWVRYQWTPVGGWNEAKLVAAALRFGFSTDATPDMGMHAVYLEVAIRKAAPEYVFGGAGAELRVEQDTNPYTGGTRALRAYTPAGQTATLTWYDGAGTPTEVAIAAGSNPQTVIIDAPDVPSVPRVEFVAAG